MSDNRSVHDKCLIVESMFAYDNGGIESGETRYIFMFFDEKFGNSNFYTKKMLRVEIKNEYYKHAIISETYPYITEYDEDADKTMNYISLINTIVSSPSFQNLNKTGVVMEWCPDKNRFLSIGVFDKNELPKNLFKGIIDEDVDNFLDKEAPKKLIIYDAKDVVGNVLGLAPRFSQKCFKDIFVCDSFEDVDISKDRVWNGEEFTSFEETGRAEPCFINEEEETQDSSNEDEEGSIIIDEDDLVF